MKQEKHYLVVAMAVSLAVAACGAPTPSSETETAGAGRAARPAVVKAPPMVIPAGTEIDVRLSTGLSSEEASEGDAFEGSLEQPVVVGEKVALAKGSAVKGKVTKAVSSGRLKQRAELWVTLTEIYQKGKKYEVATDTTGHKEGSKTMRNIIFIGGGAGGGAAIGGATGGGKGAGIGAAIGAGAGVAAAMLTGQRDIKFPPETVLRFKLEQDLTVQP